jgi:hypothetical protein
MGSRTRDLPAYGITPESSTPKLIQLINTDTKKELYFTLNSNSNEWLDVFQLEICFIKL